MAQGAVDPGRDGTPTGIVGAALTGIGAVGLTAAVVGALWAALVRQGRSAASRIEAAAIAAAQADGTLPSGAELADQAVPPRADGTYLPDGTYRPDGTTAEDGDEDGDEDGAPDNPGPGARPPSDRVLVLAMLGDSSSLGYGCSRADEVPGVVLARGAAGALRRPVAVRSLGVVGSGTADLATQVDTVLADPVDVAVVISGANDIGRRIPPWQSAARLGTAVRALRHAGIRVVAGTCPDFGVLAPIPQPLRAVVGSWSRQLAAFQARAVTAAGGRVVAIGRLVSPEFRGRPELFYGDGFHPSGPGYAKAAAALLPEVVAAMREVVGAELTTGTVGTAPDGISPAQAEAAG